jgi:hypothetical protein
MRRVAIVCGLAAVLSGCPGGLDRPERFYKDAGADCSDVENKIFIPTCGGAGCHENPGAANNLDLVSAGTAARIKTQTSTCQSKPMPTLILEKLRGTPPCGASMPLGSDPLTDNEYGCVVAYINKLDGGI